MRRNFSAMIKTACGHSRTDVLKSERRLTCRCELHGRQVDPCEDASCEDHAESSRAIEEFFNAAGECNALVEDFRQSLRMTHDFNVVDRVAADHVARAGELREDLERWAREKNKEIEENRRSLES